MTVSRIRVLTTLLAALLACTSCVAASAVAPPVVPADAGAVADAPERTSVAAATTASLDGNGTRIVTEGEELTLDVAPNQTIRGETDLEPGTELDLRIDSESFLSSRTVVVTERGTFSETFDFGGISPGTHLVISVRKDGSTLTKTVAEVGDETACEARGTSSESDSAVDGGAVESLTRVTQNETASIGVLFGTTDTLTVSIGGPSVNYVVNGTIRDRDGDGEATVLFRTDRAGTDDPTLAVTDGGRTRDIEADSETSLAAPLAPGSYDVRVHCGPNATESPVAAVGSLLVFEATGSGPTEGTHASANGTSIVVEGEELVLDAAPNQTIRGETDLEPGTELTLEVEGESSLWASTVTVTERGTFDATLDTSDVAGERLEVRVSNDDGATLAATTARVACSDGCDGETTTAFDGTDANATIRGTDDPENRLASGVGMLALGGVLAVVGIGVVLGLFRN